MNPPARPRFALDLPLLGVLLTAVAFRLWHVEVPLIDAHSWRQITNADIARHFAEGSLDLWHPRVSWGGLDGIVGMEFPLLQWITGALWRVTGESHVVARLVAAGFSVGGVFCMYGLGARLFGRAAGLAAAGLMAVSPSMTFFGRSFLSDTPMLTFMVAAVWAWDVYFERPTWRRAVLAGVLAALAPLVKLPAILVLAPIAGTGWRHRRWRVLVDGKAWICLTAAVALTAAWYWHADRIFLETGLTQAVFRPSGTYPPAVAPDVEFGSVSHWATKARLLSAEAWLEFLDRFWMLHLTAIGAAGALLGWWQARRSAGRTPVDLWALGGLALLLVAFEGQYWHEFHQLPLLPPLMLYFGVAAAPLFDAEWRRRTLPAAIGPLAVAAIALLAAVQGMRDSGALRHLYRLDNLQQRLVHAGEAVRRATDPAGLVVTVEYIDGGANSPMLLYFAHRQGWSFDVRSITAPEVEHLRARLGARYFATADWEDLSAGKPEVAALLTTTYKQIPMPKGLRSLRVFDSVRAPIGRRLRRPAATAPRRPWAERSGGRPRAPGVPCRSCFESSARA